MVKQYNRMRYREKFRRYRIFFFVMSLLFAACLVGEVFWFGNMGYSYNRESVAFSSFFSNLFVGELLFLLAVFLFGLTLYAPIFGFLCAGARGAFSGFCLSLLSSDLKSAKGIWLFLICALYLLISSWLFVAYTGFCTTTALQLFSNPSKSARGGEKSMYGGTLFYSSFFQESVNLRFLFGYILFFLGVVFFSFLLTLAFAGIRSLL